ncbi:Transmembrane protein [Armadillidium nasatum]|uniref:Transmembrane protein n=1 Tax=Armadillidium nasatum TaxID=96803 RepID=A0A5N5STN0_9CRUS|nr:Transmembrane protein [Armadillidium nasatum]
MGKLELFYLRVLNICFKFIAHSILTALFSKKKLTKEYVIQHLKNYLQSVFFLSINGTSFIGTFCVLRHILGHVNFLSASWLPGFISSVLAINAERPSRRSLLAIYVTNVASESLWNVLKERGYVKPIPKGEVLLFSLNSSKYNGRFRHHTCPHNGSCFFYTLKAGAVGWSKGYAFEVCFKLLFQFPRIIKNPLLIIQILSSKNAFGAAAFIGWFSAAFKGICCASRHISNRDKPVHGVYAGAFAALGMLFNSSPSLALYSFWKALETLYSKGVEAEVLPIIPGGIELLYSFSTAYLFHCAVWENFNLKPSYWRFLMDLTSGKIAGYNRILLDGYGLDSGRNQVWPDYDISKYFFDN